MPSQRRSLTREFAACARAVGALSTCALAACGGGRATAPDDGANPYGFATSGPAQLTVSPLDTATIFAITPLGQLSPPGHVLPTDHIYISFVDTWGGSQQNNDCRARPVRAAAAGVIDFVLVTEAAGDTKVDVQVTASFHYYYDHVLLRPGYTVGTRVAAGDTIATTTGRCPSIDLGVWDSGLTPTGFVNPGRYVGQTLHVLPPLRYFSEPLRSALYARVRLFGGVPVDKDGRTDWGVPGRLAGDWFHASLASATPEVVGGPTGWARSLAFAYDYFDRRPLLSVGGVVAPPLVTPLPDGVNPAEIAPSSGVVGFATQSYNGRAQPGWFLVQMTAVDRLRIEFFANATSRPAGFTAAAQDYVR
jgi:hypothetical protein